MREARLKERLDWFNNIDPEILKEINRRKIVKGKRKLTKPKDPKAPKQISSFFLFVPLFISPLFLYLKANFSFLDDFRKSPQASGMIATEVIKHGSQRWNEMSTAQKQVSHVNLHFLLSLFIDTLRRVGL
jgi:hypothetical protein